MTATRRRVRETETQEAVAAEHSGNQLTGISRYDRQELISGWDQEKLKKTKLVIIGSEVLANYTAITAGALGFGDIEIYGPGTIDVLDLADNEINYSNGFVPRACGSKANLMVEFIKKINPEIKARGINIRTTSPKNLSLMLKPDIIIEATNDVQSKYTMLEYGIRNNVPVVSVSSSKNKAKLGVYDPAKRRTPSEQKKYLENILFADQKGESQGTTVSAVMSSLAVDEARKIVMPINNEKPIEDILVYNLNSTERFENKNDLAINQEKDDFKDKKVLMVGAGALGNFTGLEFILNNIGELIIVDDDTIEETNLNRQILFYERVGGKKAEVLAERLSEINPNVKLYYVDERINPDSEPFFKKEKFDLIVDTVDNNKSRALLNYFSLKYKIPLISGGTRYNSGQVVVSIPGETACLNCKVNIDKMAVEAHTPQSCILAAQPSVITSNQIIGGMILGEARAILRPDKYGHSTNKILKYISQDEFRIGSLPAEQKCNCYQNEELLNTWLEKMSYLFKKK